jgi:uncharacterized membrane protein YraQ (UPF0718 family)
MNKRKTNFLIFILFTGFIGVSYLIDFGLGIKIGNNFFIFAKDMAFILPPAFILIGLFDVWVSREKVEKSFGNNSGAIKYFYAIALATTTVGGTFVAFPLANSLYHKGADYSAVFTYITAASLFMIPMSLMEASIIGIKFTLLRLGLSIPFIIISANLLKLYLNKINYKFPEVD